ncbi:YfgM family protein [Marinimicrobium sp. C2-29]|uniref:YfgM family protein n=1 Tax=Marinimicrobium sp. C2-29 TaxID=3139825 RepID=UPI003139A80B
MSEEMTEEEQLEAMKRWWKENGKWVVATVVIAVGGYFGWGAYQDQQQAKAAAGSALYTELLDTLGVQEGESLADENRSEARELVEQLKNEHAGTGYGVNAALIRARWAVSESDLDTAESELRWVLEQEPGSAVEQVATLRLARVLSAAGNSGEALTLLNGANPGESMASEYAEVRGDILLKQGDADAARSAYQSAMDGLGSQQQNRQMLLQMKLDDIQQAGTGNTTGSEENAS